MQASSTSSEEMGNVLGRRHSSGVMPSPLPSSLLKGLEPSQSPSPEMSHEEALSTPPGFHISLPGAPYAHYTTDLLLICGLPHDCSMKDCGN